MEPPALAGLTPASAPAGVGVKKASRGETPAGAGVKNFARGLTLAGGGVTKISRGKTPAGVGVRIFCRGQTPAGVRGKNISRGQAPAGGGVAKICRGQPRPPEDTGNNTDELFYITTVLMNVIYCTKCTVYFNKTARIAMRNWRDAR